MSVMKYLNSVDKMKNPSFMKISTGALSGLQAKSTWWKSFL